MVVKKGSIAYKCWRLYDVDDAEMVDGVCPICHAERADPNDKPQVLSNVGAHIAKAHSDVLDEHGIERYNKPKRCQNCNANFKGTGYVIGDLDSCCRKCYKAADAEALQPPSPSKPAPLPTLPVKVNVDKPIPGEESVVNDDGGFAGQDMPSSTPDDKGNASEVLATKVVVLKSVVGCPDSFFKGKKILDVEVYVTQRMEGDIVHVQFNYIDLLAKKVETT